MTAVSLDDILRSRDERRLRQGELLKEYGTPLISLTVVMPGEVKLNEASVYMGDSAVGEILGALGGSILFMSVNKTKPTGFEALFAVEGDALSVKRIVCGIEESHPLGRLFDIDVIRLDGRPISRSDCGLPERRCLVCGDSVRNCMRTQKHSVGEIMTKIEDIISRSQKE